VVTISRVSGSVTYSASFMLVPAMNPCPCGYYTHPTKERSCSPSTITRYQKRISGPLLDRVDVFVEVPAVEYEQLVEDQQSEDSRRPRLRVEEAREIQGARFKNAASFVTPRWAQPKSGSTAPWTIAPRAFCGRPPNGLTSWPGPSTAYSRCPVPSLISKR